MIDYWTPPKAWKGQDCYILGGGPSLEDFDFSLLLKKKVIGCNSAFLLGSHVVDIIVFGDYRWWVEIGKKGTESFGGLVVGACPRLAHEDCEWLLQMKRTQQANGLGASDSLGWNGNTGSLAINLALLLGASRIFLLGFDMAMKPDKPNWHNLRYEKGVPGVYDNFINQMKSIKRDLPKYFPGAEIINLNLESKLEYFPKADRDGHFQTVERRGLKWKN